MYQHQCFWSSIAPLIPSRYPQNYRKLSKFNDWVNFNFIAYGILLINNFKKELYATWPYRTPLSLPGCDYLNRYSTILLLVCVAKLPGLSDAIRVCIYAEEWWSRNKDGLLDTRRVESWWKFNESTVYWWNAICWIAANAWIRSLEFSTACRLVVRRMDEQIMWNWNGFDPKPWFIWDWSQLATEKKKRFPDLKNPSDSLDKKLHW